MTRGKPVSQLGGRKFGLLTAIELAGFFKGKALWRCLCDCGRSDVIARGNDLQQGKKKSCGCASVEMAVAARRTHGQAGNNRTSIYERWKSIRQRCGNPNDKAWKNYGGRGIKVCDRWRNSFEAFYADVGDPPEAWLTLDRIDNDRGYEPGNVRWATRVQQNNNRRGNGCAKINEDDVRFIRASTAKRTVLAEMFGLSTSYISDIRSGRYWGFVK